MVKYVFTDATSGEEGHRDSKPASPQDKSTPSGYRLAAHRYMVAWKQGLLPGPSTRTRELKIDKDKGLTSMDSDATIDYDYERIPVTRKRNRKPRKPKTVSGTLVTRSFILRKNGKGTQLPAPKQKHRRRKKYTFKCTKCNKHCSSVKSLNQHFKDTH